MGNKVADALSRLPTSDSVKPGLFGVQQTTSCLCLLSISDPTLLDILKDSYTQDPFLSQLIESLKMGCNIRVLFFKMDCFFFFFYKGRFYIGPKCSLIPHVLHHVHSNPLAGHFGFLKSYHRAKREFYWHGLKANLKKFIRECDICQRIKSDTFVLARLLQPLAIPATPWTDVSLDFVEGFPKSQGFKVILVVVDWLTKYVHFIPPSHPYTVAKVASLFMQHVFKRHGMPVTIVSDRNGTFNSLFWFELFKL